MVESTLISYCRLMIPEIKSVSVISDADLLIILNNGCTEFINKTDGLPTSGLFELVASKTEYPLSTYVTAFSKIRKEGCWWYNKVSSKWKKLDPTTTAYMRINFPDWLNQAAGLPQRYSIEGDTFTLHPPASAAYAGTGYIKMFYYGGSVDMSASGHYPFSGSASIRYPHLSDFEEYLLHYVKFKVMPLVGKASLGSEAGQLFYALCDKVKKDLLARADLIPEIQTQHPGMLINAGTFQGRR